MFEKEAIRYAFEKTIGVECLVKPVEDFTYEELSDNLQEKAYDFKNGAEFGYNKANEWHDINVTEPSKEQLGKQLLIRMESVIGDTDYDYLVYKYSGESITDVPGVIAWKEIK